MFHFILFMFQALMEALGLLAQRSAFSKQQHRDARAAESQRVTVRPGSLSFGALRSAQDPRTDGARPLVEFDHVDGNVQ